MSGKISAPMKRSGVVGSAAAIASRCCSASTVANRRANGAERESARAAINEPATARIAKYGAACIVPPLKVLYRPIYFEVKSFFDVVTAAAMMAAHGD